MNSVNLVLKEGVNTVMGRKELTYKLAKMLGYVELTIAVVSLSILLLVTFIGVIMRYFMGKPFIWLEEIQLASILWTVFPAGCIAFRYKAHVAIEIFVDMMPKKMQKVMEVIIGVLIIATLLFFHESLQTYLAIFMRSGRSTPILKIPYTIVYGVAPICCVLMIVEFLISVFLPELNGEEEEL